MRNKMFFPIFAVGLVMCLVINATAQMQSPNYRTPSVVLSGGGVSMQATSYQTNATFGQPSPLPDPADLPFSDSYDLYPGFWYIMVASIPPNDCPGDFENDGDVDGSDLAVFAADFGRTDCIE